MEPRRAAVTALVKVHEDGSYSNILLENLPTPQNDADFALTTRLIYGVVERRLTLDYLLNVCSSTPVKKMQPTIREILRVGVYQLVFMDHIPAFAVIHEMVELTRGMGFSRLTGYVNGVLRHIQKDAQTLINQLPTTDKGLEMRYSCPRTWIRAWREAYGEECLHGLLEFINEAPPSYIRVNTYRTTVSDFTARLERLSISYKVIEGLPAALEMVNASTLRQLPKEMQSLYYFQDIASQWCCAALSPQPGERVADVCAAPGGKTMTLAQMMENQGQVIAGDIYPHKCDTLHRRAKQYGLSCIDVMNRDASTPPPAEWVGAFDRVLCDAPCSGLGVIRRKPEIRYKSPDDFAELPALQLQILSQAAIMVRPGGVLHYSTCTLRPQENEEVAKAFLASHPDFEPRKLPLERCFATSNQSSDYCITLFPHIHGSDGFFIAGFQKR